MNILWKLELHHGKRDDNDPRWNDIISCVPLPTAHFSGLFDILVVNALARVQRFDDAHQMIAGIAEAAEATPSFSRKQSLQLIALPIAHASVAFQRAEFSKAVELLSPIMHHHFGIKCDQAQGDDDEREAADDFLLPPISCLGGSSEQREVLHEMFALSLLRLGRKEEAAAYNVMAGLPIPVTKSL